MTADSLTRARRLGIRLIFDESMSTTAENLRAVSAVAPLQSHSGVWIRLGVGGSTQVTLFRRHVISHTHSHITYR